MFMVATCYLIANSFSFSRLFFGQIPSAFLDHLRESSLLVLPENSYQPRGTNQSLKKYNLRGPGKVFKRSLFYFIFKKSCNIDIILYCRARDNLKYSNSSIKLLNSSPRYFLIKLIYQELGHVFLWFCSLLIPPLPTSRVQGPLL